MVGSARGGRPVKALGPAVNPAHAQRELRAATRDASYANRPRTSGPVKYHAVTDHKKEVAACGEWLFCHTRGIDHTIPAADVAPSMRCQKPACRALWPGPRPEGVSPYALIQEELSKDLHYPWRVIVCCALLNQTTGAQVRPMVEELFRRCPTPDALLTADLSDLLLPLGLQDRRAGLLRRMTWDYLTGVQPGHCFGVGGYGRDALLLFVHGEKNVSGVRDNWLRAYASWRSNPIGLASYTVVWDLAGHCRWRALCGFHSLRAVWSRAR